MTPDEVLQGRARQLARPLPDDDSTTASTGLLRFRYADEQYALELGQALQVVPLSGAARLPDDAWPLIALGLMAGDIIPVLEFQTTGGRRARRQLPQNGIAVEAEGMVLIVPADDVHGVTEVAAADVDSVAPDSTPGATFLRGITRQGDGLLDVRALVEMARSPRSDGAASPGSPQERTDR